MAANIYYEESGNRDGTPVLLLPGWGGSISDLAEVEQAIVSAGYRVIAADLPGSGRSEPQPRAYHANYLEEDAHSMLALLQSLGAEPAHVVGFSDGGEDALLMAIIAPDAVRSIAAWGSAGVMHDPGGHMADAMFNMIDNPIPPMAGFSEYMKATYGEDNARAMTQNFAGAIRDIVQRGGDISLSRAGSIQCPVLLITGENDFLAAPTLVSQLAEAIPDVTFIVAEGAGHPVHQDRSEWLIGQVMSWLAAR